MYAAFKIHEVLGLSAQYQHTEQLGHSQLFSLQEKSDNLLFLSPSSDKKTSEVFRALSKSGFNAHLLKSGFNAHLLKSGFNAHLLKSGFNAHLLKSGAADPIPAALQVIFCLQHLALYLGRKTGLQECAFVTDKKRLALSSRLIY